MSLSKLTKAELIALIKERDTEIEKLRLAAATARPISPPKGPVGSVRYWDEFETRGLALAWAKEARGVLKQRPTVAA
jgi:hypothetical protein